MSEIDLGFAEERESAWLTNRYFPSKVGGKPAWLELDALPSKDDLQCGKCGRPLAFLCQIYAPFEDDHNFHRSIFVFVCRSEGCLEPNKSNNLKVLRSQLPRENTFYAPEAPSEEGDALPSIAPNKKLCLACGCPGPLACSLCKKAHYCSAHHQKIHWPHHKKICSPDCSSVDEVNLPEVVFPEWEIVIDSDDHETVSPEAKVNESNEERERERLAEFEKLAAEGKTGVLGDVPVSELDKYAQGAEAVDDKHFRKFKKELGKEPDQIVRYKRSGDPLWIADVRQTVQAQLDVPNCEACGGPRTFEFQIMPQMLNLLKDDKLDWGVLAVYTCASSCKPKAGVGYLPEYVVKQDIIGEKE